MLSKESLDFILRVTDYFHGHWEDPEWGRRQLDQVLVNLVIHEYANGIADEEARKQIQSVTAKAVAKSAQGIAKQ